MGNALYGETGPYAGRSYAIPPDGLKVGRDPNQNKLVLADAEASRRHAELRVQPDGSVVVEDSSVNGTYVNEKRVEKAVLKPGDRVRFALRPESVFVFRPGPATATPSTAPRASGASPSSPGGSAAAAQMAKEFRRTVVMREEPDTGAVPAARLQLVLDQYAVEDHPLGPGARIVVGRAPGPGGLAIDHPTVSDAHAEVAFLADGRANLRDLNSQYGTYVNGERVQERPLSEGDLIRLGNCDGRTLLYREPHRRSLLLRDLNLDRAVNSLGRAPDNSIRINHPTVSLYHAEVRKQGTAFELIDRNSTNGTYVNGARVARQVLKPRDRIALGAIQLVFDGAQIEQQADANGVRLAASALHRAIKLPATGRELVLLHNVSLVIEPREFVGLLGPAGAGKSTLMYALNGTRPAERGRVTLNNADLYREYQALRALIGYLPQEDILHRALTVRECLFYAARLRLPDDFDDREINERVNEVIRSLDLAERADVVIGQVSGGQRKRVSLGIELLSKPSLLFMDEPTAGQDPRTEMRMMQLFREIANRGATVVCTTHLLGSFSLLDKVAVLVNGHLAYFGPSREMLDYFRTKRPPDVYDRLQERSPEDWGQRFRESDLYKENVKELSEETVKTASSAPPKEDGKRSRTSFARQFRTLLSRQLRLRVAGWSNLVNILVAPAVVALLVGLMQKDTPNDPKMLFMIVFSALWFGCSASVREIVDEQAIYRRERERNLRIPAYLGSKLAYLAGVAAVQAFLFISLLTLTGAQDGHFGEAFGIMAMMGLQGALMGLVISALASSPEKALYVFPLALIPQLLLAGFIIPIQKPVDAFVVERQERRMVISQVPSVFVQEPMAPVIARTLSPLMVARWGLEWLADTYIHDFYSTADPETAKAAIMTVDQLHITFHPDELKRARQRAETLRAQLASEAAPAAWPAPPPAAPRYLGVLLAFVFVMTALTAGAVRWKDLRGQR